MVVRLSGVEVPFAESLCADFDSAQSDKNENKKLAKIREIRDKKKTIKQQNK